MKNYSWPGLVFVLTITLTLIIAVFDSTVRFIAITDPPTEYMVKNLEEQLECAKRVGFKIKRPILRVMKSQPGGNKFNGIANNLWPRDFIRLVPYASYQTMAHELGHVVDYQTSRRGNPELKKIKDLSMEAFADVIMDKILAECQKP